MGKKKLAQGLVQIVLFIIFFEVFGEPSYRAFIKQDIVMKESKSTVSNLPAISICLVFNRFWETYTLISKTI